jgi:hypothetical protein
MTAIAALLDVTAERGGAATPDRGHRLAPFGRQRHAVLVTESRAKWRNTSATSNPSRAGVTRRNGHRFTLRPSRRWGVRPLSETGGEPNAPRRRNPGRAYRSRRRSGLSASNERPLETSAFVVGQSFADAAAIAPCSR